ncbi:hypothetical protein FOMPIDRAFT_1019373 [Fomitopsis schrenkii]|uniref:Uncharacterized protein n=1 Tax=Fomitopsis schrenkii TaxID=2126942 RepID=S8DWH2_FOMSC|nr:hypothetical protein FOMPIDRAFT_1019373 [Fomitopsis schrenkii]
MPTPTSGPPVLSNRTAEAARLSEHCSPDGPTRPESPSYAEVAAGRKSPSPEAGGLPTRQDAAEGAQPLQLRAMRCPDDEAIPDIQLDDAATRAAALEHALATDPTPREAADIAAGEKANLVGEQLPLPEQTATAKGAQPPKKAPSKGKGKVVPRPKKRGAVGQGLPSSTASSTPTADARQGVTHDRITSDARKRRRVTDDVEDGRTEPPTDDRVQNAESESFAQTARPAAGLFVYDDADTLARPPPVTPPPVRRMPPNQPGWGPEEEYLVSYWRERESHNWQTFPSYPFPLPTASSTPAPDQSSRTAAVGIIPECPWLTITPVAGPRGGPITSAARSGWSQPTDPEPLPPLTADTQQAYPVPVLHDHTTSLDIDYDHRSAGSWRTVPTRGGTTRDYEPARPQTPEITAGMYAPLASPPDDAMLVDEPLTHATYHPLEPVQLAPPPSPPRAPTPAHAPDQNPARRSFTSGHRTSPTSCPPMRRLRSPDQSASASTPHTRIPRFTRRLATDFMRMSDHTRTSPKEASINKHAHRLERLRQPPLGTAEVQDEQLQGVTAGAPPPPPPPGGGSPTIVPAVPLPQGGHVHLHTPGLNITRTPREGWPRTELRSPTSWRDGQEEEQADAWGVEGGGVRVFVHFAAHGAQDMGTNDRIEAAQGIFIAEFQVDTNGIHIIPSLPRAVGPLRANQSPTYFAVIGMDATAAIRIAGYGWISTSRVTMRLEFLRDAPPNYLGAFLHVRRFGSMHNDDIAARVRNIIREDAIVAGEIRAIIERDIAAGGRWRQYPVEIVFDHVLSSLTVNIIPLRTRGAEAEPLARIYIEPPTANASDWLTFRAMIMGLRLGDVLTGHPVPFAGTLWCALCHSHDHPTTNCTLPSVPGQSTAAHVADEGAAAAAAAEAGAAAGAAEGAVGAAAAGAAAGAAEGAVGAAAAGAAAGAAEGAVGAAAAGAAAGAAEGAVGAAAAGAAAGAAEGAVGAAAAGAAAGAAEGAVGAAAAGAAAGAAEGAVGAAAAGAAAGAAEGAVGAAAADRLIRATSTTTRGAITAAATLTMATKAAAHREAPQLQPTEAPQVATGEAAKRSGSPSSPPPLLTTATTQCHRQALVGYSKRVD